MEGDIEKPIAGTASVEFWEGNAEWYKLWVEHNSYHDRIIGILTSLVKPGWKVLDIGAGHGILSLPLAAMGCRVTSIEPSTAMRRLFEYQLIKRGISSIAIQTCRWEDIPISAVYDHDLIIASNSLHLTEDGFLPALEKVFLAKPLHVFVVSENQFISHSSCPGASGYDRFFEANYTIESSYAYHSLEDAFEHWKFRHGRQPDDAERRAIISGLIYERRHLWNKGSANVSLFWWKQKGAVTCSRILGKEAFNEHHQDDFLSYSLHDFSSIC